MQILEQYHRTGSSVRLDQATIAGVDLVRMIYKWQLYLMNEASNINQFNRLAA